MIQQEKEITIQQNEDKNQEIFKNNQTNQKNENTSANINLNIQPQPFKDISSLSPGKCIGKFKGNQSKMSKPKNKNFWVLKNRTSLLKQNIQQENKQNPQNQQDLQNENQENQIQQQKSRKQSNGQDDYTSNITKHGSSQQGIIQTIDILKQNSNNDQNLNQEQNLQSNDQNSNQDKQSQFGLSKQDSQQQDKQNDQIVEDSKDKDSSKKIKQIQQRGYECEAEIENDHIFINKILSEGKYRPTEIEKDQYEKLVSESLLGSEDKRAVGSLLGITVFGIIGFVASGLNPIGLVAGSVAGGFIGQYAGRKIKKKLTRAKKLLFFDLFTLKLNCYIRIGIELMKALKFDINTYRFYIEKVLEEMKVVIQYRSFRQKFHKDIKKILDKMLNLMKKDPCYKAIFLSYKLTRQIIKRKRNQQRILESNENQSRHSSNAPPQFTQEEEKQIIDAIINVLYPTLNILRESSPDQLNPTLKQFQFKLERLLKEYEILYLIEKGNQVAENKKQTLKQIEELDQLLDQELNLEAFKRILKQEHIKEFIEKDNLKNSQQVQNEIQTPKSQKMNGGDTATHKNKTDAQGFTSNKNQGESQAKNGDDLDLRIIDIFKIMKQKDEQKDQQLEKIDHQNSKEKENQNIPSQYPPSNKQHPSKIAQKECINQSPMNQFKNNKEEQEEMDRINQRKQSSQGENIQNEYSTISTNIKELQSNKLNKISSQQVKFDQLPQKNNIEVDDESIKSYSSLQQSTMKNEKNEGIKQIPNGKLPSLGKIKVDDSQMNTFANIQDPSQTQINSNIRDPTRSFQLNDNRPHCQLKMNSEESLFSTKRERSPKNEKQRQLIGDIESPSAMKDSILLSSQIHDQDQKGKVLNDSPTKRKSHFGLIESQKRGSIKLNNIQLYPNQKANSQFRQSIVTRDDNHKEEIVVVNIPEIQKEDKMQQSIQKEDPNKLDAPTQEKFDRLISLVKEDPEKTWECVIKKDDSMFIYKKMIPGNPCVLVRAESLVKDCNSEEVFVQIYQAEIRSQWDKVTQGFTVIETIQEGVDVIYFFVDPGLGVTKRDFCQRRVLKKDYPEKGQITIVFFSITHPNCPERKGYIRAHSHIAGYVIRPVGNDTSLTIMTQSDVKGSVPKYVVNFMAARAPPKWIESMKKGCLDYRNIQKGQKNKKK